MKKNHVLWIVALIIVNSGWYALTQKSASQEINRPGAEFSPEREGDITALIGDNSDYELVHCFKSINGGIYNVSINMQMDSKTLYSWNGTTDDDCITFSSSTEEGEIIIFTVVEEGVESTTTLYTWPLKNALVPGAIIFSLATLLVAYGETIVRNVIKKKLDKIDATAAERTTESTDTTSAIWQDPVRPQ
tara:strand:+ start:5911 stop:6480 length:570 start_codon:yes stop_codon:yes gene_type:complete